MSKLIKKVLLPNAHTQDDFHLFDSAGLPLKTQTLLWYLEKIRDSLEDDRTMSKTGKSERFDGVESLERRLEYITWDIENNLNLLCQLIKKLRHDEYRQVAHISKTVKHMLRTRDEFCS